MLKIKLVYKKFPELTISEDTPNSFLFSSNPKILTLHAKSTQDGNDYLLYQK